MILNVRKCRLPDMSCLWIYKLNAFNCLLLFAKDVFLHITLKMKVSLNSIFNINSSYLFSSFHSQWLYSFGNFRTKLSMKIISRMKWNKKIQSFHLPLQHSAAMMGNSTHFAILTLPVLSLSQRFEIFKIQNSTTIFPKLNTPFKISKITNWVLLYYNCGTNLN